MNKYTRLFKKTIEIELSNDLAYKANFLIKLVAAMSWDLIGPLIMFLIYNNSSGIPGWAFEEFLVFQGSFLIVMGFGHLLFTDMVFRVIWNVKEGHFDNYLLKPYNTLGMMSVSNFAWTSLADLIVGTGLITYGLVINQVNPFGLNGVFFLISIVLGLLVFHAICVVIASLSFLVVQSFSLYDLVMRFTDFSRYPLTIYSAGMQFAFTFLLPIAVMAFYPSTALLQGLSVIGLAKVAIPVLLVWVVSLGIWNMAMKKYTSAGG